MRRLIILAEVALGLLFASCTKEEQRTLSVIPAPLKVELQQEVFSLNSETGLYIDASEGDKKILEDYLVASSMNLKPVIAEEGHNVVLKQVAELPEVNSSEGYVLTVTPDQVLIRATSGAGLFYGVHNVGDNVGGMEFRLCCKWLMKKDCRQESLQMNPVLLIVAL